MTSSIVTTIVSLQSKLKARDKTKTWMKAAAIGTQSGYLVSKSDIESQSNSDDDGEDINKVVENERHLIYALIITYCTSFYFIIYSISTKME